MQNKAKQCGEKVARKEIFNKECEGVGEGFCMGHHVNGSVINLILLLFDLAYYINSNWAFNVRSWCTRECKATEFVNEPKDELQQVFYEWELLAALGVASMNQ